MKKVLLYSAFLFLVGVVFQSCSNSDEKIKNDVENALSTRYNSVSVSVNDKVVTLTGSLMSQAERASAESVARSVNDVRSVVNNITVQEPTPTVTTTSDDVLRTSLESRIHADGFREVTVQVTNGEVVLSGNLPRNDLQRVMQMANETQGVTRVTNNLTLR